MGWIHSDTDDSFSIPGTSDNADNPSRETYIYVLPEDKANLEKWEGRIKLLGRKAVGWFNECYGGSWEQVSQRHPTFFIEYDPERGRYIDPKTGRCEGIKYNLEDMCLFLFKDCIEIPTRPNIKVEVRYIDTNELVNKDIKEVDF